MKIDKVTVELEHYDTSDPEQVTGAMLQPIGIRFGPQYSGSGFRNSDGTSTMRRPEYAVAMAEKIARLINESGGLEEDPYMEEHDAWMRDPDKRW